MSLIRLRTFIEVYRQRSISSAARSLNLTQPAVSQHIAGLEMAIGRPLFERLVRGVSPTRAADELAADIGDKLDAAEAALSSARARSVEMTGALQIIGHADFLAEVVGVHVVPLLEAGIRVRLQTGGADLINQMVIEGHCDLGVSAFPTSDKRLHCERIRSERLLAVAAPAVIERISRSPSLDKALTQEPLLAYNLEIPLVDSWAARNKLKLGQIIPALIGQDLRTLRSVLCKGFGWSVLPEYLCHAQIEKGELQELPGTAVDDALSYYLIWTPSALRQARVAHARQTLLWKLKPER
ncbi:LysR family transcriptional regulator [Pokkaliibacter sp. MBI-7]|uniref:LysR family transcriptional regulator n=1 Tax=Pokkaliibacter sp. MBI-7 TaxID=3040600 RepID=UPI00244A9BB0|nr:LysR family transcriptional regulator [Pokkaliibacter sp. MBI-7]MDH2435412.1 LysR family transcriptional regulator [Pokkaliibacter sp. MBI-7]